MQRLVKKYCRFCSTMRTYIKFGILNSTCVWEKIAAVCWHTRNAQPARNAHSSLSPRCTPCQKGCTETPPAPAIKTNPVSEQRELEN